MCKRLFNLDEPDAKTLFLTLDINKEGKIEVTHLITAITNYRTDDKPDEEIVIKTREELVAQHADPKSTASNNMYIVNKFMDQHEIKIMMIYRLADMEQKGVVYKNELVISFERLLPSAPKTVVDAFEGLFPDEKVEKDAFAKMFDTQTDEPLGARDNTKDKNGLTVSQVYWLKKYHQATVDADTTYQEVFDSSDKYGYRVLGVAPLTKGITNKIDSLSSMDIINIIAAFEIPSTIDFERYENMIRYASTSSHSASALAEFERQRNVMKTPVKSPEKSKTARSDPPKQVEQ